jgi:hypothetical protein
VTADRHRKPVDAEPPGLDVCRGNSARPALSGNELRLGRACAPGSIRDHPVHTATSNAANDNSINSAHRRHDLTREVADFPSSERRGVLTTDLLPIEARPLDARVADVNEQHALPPNGRAAARAPAARQADRPPADNRHTPAQLVALTDTSPEMNFFNP